MPTRSFLELKTRLLEGPRAAGSSAVPTPKLDCLFPREAFQRSLCNACYTRCTAFHRFFGVSGGAGRSRRPEPASLDRIMVLNRLDTASPCVSILGIAPIRLKPSSFFGGLRPGPDRPVRPNPCRPHPPKTLDAIRQRYKATAFFRAVPARTGVSAATVSHHPRADCRWKARTITLA